MASRLRQNERMRAPLADVREGMPVYDSANESIGTVRDVYLGSEAQIAADAPPTAHSFIDDIVQALAPEPLPEPVRARLRREGFIRIDMTGPFRSDRYAFASQIRAVSNDAVTLDVGRADLVSRPSRLSGRD